MVSIYRSLLIILLFIAFSACDQSKQKNQDFFDNFHLEDVLVIDQSKTNYISNETVHKINGDTLISYYDKSDKSLIVLKLNGIVEYSLCLDSFFLSHRIDFLGDYHFVDLDTIFVLATHRAASGNRLAYGVYHFDIDGNIHKHWDINKIMKMENPWFNVNSSYSRSINGLEYKDGSLFCTTDINKKPFSEFNVNDIPVVFILDIQSSTGKFIFGKPKIYGEGDFYGNHVDRQTLVMLSDSTFVLSYPLAHHLLLFNKKGQLVKKTSCKSNFIDEFKYFPKGEEYTSRQLLDAQECFPYYYTLLYDKNLFYRVVFHKQPIINEDGIKNNSYNRNISIIVMNRNFDVLGEYFIPPKRFKPFPVKVDNFGAGLFMELRDNPNDISVAKYVLNNNKKKK